MDEPLLDPDASLERLAAWKGRLDRMAADTKSMGELTSAETPQQRCSTQIRRDAEGEQGDGEAELPWLVALA
ncbi:hypothetical protein [Lentzea sp. NPDC059081]|uniref:hypothetical protein n=1 Tax=Lentzea sp. NPDC059081 TaxID=3346719 RepID=UPI00369E3908